MTFWSRAISFPPILCRLLARHRHGPPLSTQEISQRSAPNGVSVLHPVQVEVISQAPYWRHIEMEDMAKFLRGCGTDFCHGPSMRIIDDYMRRRPTFQYLRLSPLWEDYYHPMLRRWRDSAVLNKADLHPSVLKLLTRLC